MGRAAAAACRKMFSTHADYLLDSTYIVVVAFN
jgi:hypothetical protein